MAPRAASACRGQRATVLAMRAATTPGMATDGAACRVVAKQGRWALPPVGRRRGGDSQRGARSAPSPACLPDYSRWCAVGPSLPGVTEPMVPGQRLCDGGSPRGRQSPPVLTPSPFPRTSCSRAAGPGRGTTRSRPPHTLARCRCRLEDQVVACRGISCCW